MKINIQNIDTYLMSYIDNELSLTDRKEVELFIEAHPAYAKELALLKQTVLEANEVVYEDKHLLYRYSEMEASLPSAFKKQLYRQEAKVVEAFFTRTNIIRISSVAALLFLLIGYRFYTSNNDLNYASFSKSEKVNTKNGDEGIIANTQQTTINGKLAKENGDALMTANDEMFENKNLLLGKETRFKIVNKKQIVSDKQSDMEVSNLIAFNSNEQNAAASTISKTSITPNSETNELTNKTIAEIEPTNINENNIENTKQEIANASTSIEEKESYENIDTDERDRSVYIANLEIDGDKIRGFSRRINALFKRNKNEKQK